MARKKWQALKPWEPFFWESRLPTGIYLRSQRRPALFPTGPLVDEEIYFAIRFEADLEKPALRFYRYAFLINPGKHTRRSVRREGYWFFDWTPASSPSEAMGVIKDVMQSIEILAFEQNTIVIHDDIALASLVAWEERIVLALHTQQK